MENIYYTDPRPVQIVSFRSATARNNSCKSFENPLSSVFNFEALHAILNHESVCNLPVVGISMIGPFRCGKSFLLNCLLQYLKGLPQYKDESLWETKTLDEIETTMANQHRTYTQDEEEIRLSWLKLEGSKPRKGFAWDAGSESHTEGIWAWSEAIRVRVGQKPYAFLLLDTQGMFSMKAGVNETKLMLLLSSQLSSLILYNVRGLLTTDSFDALHFFANYGPEALLKTNDYLIRTESTHAMEQSKPFQELMILVRDWHHPGTYPYGLDGGSDYLAKILDKVQTMEKNQNEKACEELVDSYDNVSCFLLPDPGDASIESCGELENLSKKFKDCVAALVKQVVHTSILHPKRIGNIQVTGAELYDFIANYAIFPHAPKQVPRPVSSPVPNKWDILEAEILTIVDNVDQSNSAMTKVLHEQTSTVMAPKQIGLSTPKLGELKDTDTSDSTRAVKYYDSRSTLRPFLKDVEQDATALKDWPASKVGKKQKTHDSADDLRGFGLAEYRKHLSVMYAATDSTEQTGLQWVKTDSGIPPQAVVGGYDKKKQPFYVGRAHLSGHGLLPGSIEADGAHINFPYRGAKQSRSYEVLVKHNGTDTRLEWIPISDQNPLPADAVIAGVEDGHTLVYVGRHLHDGALTVGKVHPKHRALYLTWDNEELNFSVYEVLVNRKIQSATFQNSQTDKNENALRWVTASNGVVPKFAVAGGCDGKATCFVGRSTYQNVETGKTVCVIPGNFSPNEDILHYGGKTSSSYELLINDGNRANLQWLSPKSIDAFTNVVPGGFELHLGAHTPLFIGRKFYKDRMIIGKVLLQDNCICILVDAAEKCFTDDYDILVCQEQGHVES